MLKQVHAGRAFAKGASVLLVAFLFLLAKATPAPAEKAIEPQRQTPGGFWEYVWPNPQRDVLPPPRAGSAGYAGGTAGVHAGMDLPLGILLNEPSVAVNPTNPNNIAVTGPDRVRVSNDGGATFQPAVLLAVPPMYSIGGNAVATFDSQGRLFVTYLANPPFQGIDIIVSQLDPATGATLPGYPVNVTTSPGVNIPGSVFHMHDKPWIAADMNPASPFADRIYLLWTDFSLLEGANVILTTYSSDQGLTWTPALMVSDSLVEGFVWPSNNYVANNGDLYIAYHSQPAEGFDLTGNPNGMFGQMIVMRSVDGGASFVSKTKAFDHGFADATFNVQSQSGAVPGFRAWMQPNAQPWVFSDPIRPGRVYAVTADDPDNDTTTAGNDPNLGGDASNVYIAISEDHGQTWMPPIRVDGGPAGTLQVLPTASIDRESGCIVVHYYDNRASLTATATDNFEYFLLDVYMTASTDGGMTFSADFRINDAPFDPDIGAPRFGVPPTTRIGDYNHVAVVDCRAYSVWTGNSLNMSGDPIGQQIFFESSENACDGAAEATAPSIFCPSNLVLECDESTEPSVAGAGVASAIDGCDSADVGTPLDQITLGDCTDERTILRTWSAEDASGSISTCLQTIEIFDTTPPEADCPANEITIECTQMVQPIPAMFSDNCDTSVSVMHSQTIVVGDCPQEFTAMQTATGTDNCGNMATCMRAVHVVDTGNPTTSCPPNASVSCELPRTPAQLGSATASDACDASVTPTFSDQNSLNGCNGTGTISRTWTGTDDCGNSHSCVQTITVFDDTDPMIMCPSNVTRECGQSTAPAATGSASATDNCDPTVTPTSTDQNNLTGCNNTGTIMRTWRSQDDCGNFAECLQTITVQDTTGPSITCPPNRTVECGQSTAPAATGSATATDVCDSTPTISFMDSVNEAPCGSTRTITRTWTATDDCTNSNSCIQTINVVDTTLPSISCPANVVVTCQVAEGVPVGDIPLMATASDLCDTPTIIDNRPAEFFPPTCSATGGTVVTFTALDACGNMRSCTTRVSVIGDECCPGRIELDSDLTLLQMQLDLRQDSTGPVRTKANFDIWNSNEVRFSGTHKCVNCWDQTLFSLYGVVGGPGAPENPNHLLMNALQTDKGKARIDGVGSTECPGSIAVPLLGLSIKELKLNGSPTATMRTASPLPGSGTQAGGIQYDIITGPSEASLPESENGLTSGDNLVVQGPPPQLLENVGGSPPNTAGVVIEERSSISNKGSLLVWPKVELKWNSAGQLIQDTFLTIVNDRPNEVKVQFYFVQGDGPLDPVIIQGQLIERGHPGWNWVDVQIALTGDESAYWSAASGLPKGVSPYTVLDHGPPAGRPDLDPLNPGGRLLRGFVVGWAVNSSGREIRWNHLTGKAIMIHYAHATALDYEATAFRCVSEVAEGAEPNDQPGDLRLDGVEYSHAPNTLILDFFATPSEAMSHPDARP